MLPVEKKPSYLSFSSLNDFESQPNKFYLQRMAPDPYPREPQSIAAAVGSSFDVMIKNYLLNQNCLESGENKDEIFERILKSAPDGEKYIKEGKSFFDTFFEMSVEAPHRAEAKGAGLKLCTDYINFLKVANIPMNFHSLEIHKNFTLLNEEVPLFMKLDASFKEGGLLLPHDWKVKGYSSQASPPAGYAMLINEKGVQPAHSKYRTDMPFEEIDLPWAGQLATYGWGLGRIPGKPFKACIHALICRATGMRVAIYYGVITSEFQQKLINRYRDAWNSIQSGNFVRSLGNELAIVEMAAMNERWYR